ncbi:MAG TPA: HNH endonuclease signature motif containing protein, partial [Acidimicrobiales bacterium]|nr:HNH endonuclease signature motif containing protein [Acidimicrobiales bacterium]
FFTGGWRRAVEVRDRVCQHPTCDITAEYCQVDHIIEHADGGPTSVANGRLLCPQHNHQRPGRQPPPASRRDNPDRGAASGSGSAPDGDDDGDPDQP